MFDWARIAASHQDIAKLYIGELREPDYSFLPGREYQYRWYVAPRVRAPKLPAVFLHIMTGDDPTGELHDHDWDNVSLVLAGRMIETCAFDCKRPFERALTQGFVLYRLATDRHSLRLDGCPYAMTLFAVGPKVRDNKTYKVQE